MSLCFVLNQALLPFNRRFALKLPTYSIIRPVRAVVRDIPEKRRSTVEILLVSPHRKHSSTSIAVTADFEPTGGPRKKKGSCDDNRLSSIMNFLPLREAFGEYCRKFLCSEVRS